MTFLTRGTSDGDPSDGDRLDSGVPRHATHAGPDARRAAQQTVKAIGVPLLLAGVVTAGSPGWSTYQIKRGDTLSEIATRYHTTVAALVKANSLPGNGNLIYAGEMLRVPVARKPAAKAAARYETRTVVHKYRVVTGDSLIRIARMYGVAPEVIARANKLPSSLIVRLGDVLDVPRRERVKVSAGAPATSQRKATSANTFAGRTYASATVAAAARNRAYLEGTKQPTRAQIKSMIVKTARKYGVDPNLALAVSWQETGWNHRRVSVANAIGAMQVIPSTGEWASDVVGRRLNLLKAQDNVTAGVVLLQVLTRSASQRDAVAGYYQGLASVRRNGMYADTKQYVANVMALKARFAG